MNNNIANLNSIIEQSTISLLDWNLLIFSVVATLVISIIDYICSFRLRHLLARQSLITYFSSMLAVLLAFFAFQQSFIQPSLTKLSTDIKELNINVTKHETQFNDLQKQFDNALHSVPIPTKLSKQFNELVRLRADIFELKELMNKRAKIAQSLDVSRLQPIITAFLIASFVLFIVAISCPDNPECERSNSFFEGALRIEIIHSILLFGAAIAHIYFILLLIYHHQHVTEVITVLQSTV